jgi:CPA2 family monovalent cation:H+ antiporter-2
VRALSPQVPILARAHGAAARDGLARAGASEVIEPELEAAATLIRHALRGLALPQATVLDYLTRFRAAMNPVALGTPGRPGAESTLPEIHEVALGAGSLADRSLGEARVRERLGVTVVSIERAGGETLVNPSAETRLRSGDRLRVFGLPEQIDAFRAEAGRGV